MRSSYFFTTTMYSSTIRICSLLQRWHSDSCSWHQMSSTTNIGNRSWDATCSTSMYKWELMSLSRKESIYWEVKIWRNGSGSLLISRKHSWDATGNHSRMTPLTLLIQNFSFRTSSEDTQMILSKNHSQLHHPGSVFERDRWWVFVYWRLNLI